MRRLIDDLRFRLAFSDARRDLLKNLALIAGLLVCFGIVGRMDYEDALRTEAEAHAAIAELNRAALLGCLNQQMTGLYIERDDGVREHLVCGEPYYINDQNTRNSRG